MKVYICLESYHNHDNMAAKEREVSVMGTFATLAEAQKEVEKRQNEIADEITGMDENNSSAISEIQPLCGGTEAVIESEWLDRWEWRIVSNEVVAD